MVDLHWSKDTKYKWKKNDFWISNLKILIPYG